MKKRILLLVAAAQAAFFLTPFNAGAQENLSLTDSLKQYIVPDDPIAAMLDSLLNEKYFQSSQKHLKNKTQNKHRFAADSVPLYDDETYAARMAKLDAKSPIKLDYNSAVKNYIQLYGVRKREMVSRMLGLTQLYFPMFEEKLDKYGLPLELKYLAIVESALNPLAKSRSGAMGLWQFMYSTGKMYDLNVTSYVDERCDPLKATEAACKYLKFLHGIFGDWHLALAAYNAGPGTVNKAIRRSGGKRNYWDLMPYLPRETNGYVPAFIAVNYIMNHTQEHNLNPTPPRYYYYEVDTVNVRQEIDMVQLAAALGVPVEEVQFLNPVYKKGVVPRNVTDPYALCLPVRAIGCFINNENTIYQCAAQAQTQEDEVRSEVRQQVRKIHTVRKGENLSLIARKYNCSTKDLREWNRLSSSFLRYGQKLTVYVYETRPAAAAAAPKQEVKTAGAAPGKSDFIIYTIQPGDTLWKIATRYPGVSAEDIKRINKITDTRSLKPGTKIKVAVAG